MTTTTSATPGPDDAAVSTATLPATSAPAEPNASAPVPVRRTLGTGAIIGIVAGGIVLIGLIFGGGIAVGLAIPTGGGVQGPGSSEGGFPGGPGGTGGPGSGTEDGQRTRPSAPDSDSDSDSESDSGTNQQRPTAPNSDDTGTDDGAEQG